jgi:hypothetical protein
MLQTEDLIMTWYFNRSWSLCVDFADFARSRGISEDCACALRLWRSMLVLAQQKACVVSAARVSFVLARGWWGWTWTERQWERGRVERAEGWCLKGFLSCDVVKLVSAEEEWRNSFLYLWRNGEHEYAGEWAEAIKESEEMPQSFKPAVPTVRR